ncbi:hypothetical protein [Fusibacter sp. 3D3]|uniref:hypothetical protein n=1 Tax=Fusibacter sp. 3D3 TaxID=1048380 RepID=UPI00085343A4|nr:hypothetical protein [Fusibacter sp. 3D3]GAU79493.1 hypothetical protein F3D3_4157 [Fusibacter sp. 3D3]
MTKEIAMEYGLMIAVAGAVFLFVLLKWQQVKVVLFRLMLTAKSMAKDAILSSGKEQEEWVLKKAYQHLPIWITLWISKETMRKLIAYLYQVAKDYLDDGLINQSIR